MIHTSKNSTAFYPVNVEQAEQLRHFISADLFDYFARILELSHTTAR